MTGKTITPGSQPTDYGERLAQLSPQTYPPVSSASGWARELDSHIVERRGNPTPVDVDIVLPVYNEEAQLTDHVRLLCDYLEQLPQSEPSAAHSFSWNIVIADNASTDLTWPLALTLTEQFPDRVRAVRIKAKGRGRALKVAWGQSLASVVAYMDIDLSTDISDIGFLVGSLLMGGADVAIGSRLLNSSDVKRSFKREFISRTYNQMLRAYLGARFHDAQCGFKALTAAAAVKLLPLIEDNEWFFDTELLVLAQYCGLLVYEIPVTWVEDKGSTVDISDTIAKDIEGMHRLKRELVTATTRSGRALPLARWGTARLGQAAGSQAGELDADSRLGSTVSALIANSIVTI